MNKSRVKSPTLKEDDKNTDNKVSTKDSETAIGSQE